MIDGALLFSAALLITIVLTELLLLAACERELLLSFAAISNGCRSFVLAHSLACNLLYTHEASDDDDDETTEANSLVAAAFLSIRSCNSCQHFVCLCVEFGSPTFANRQENKDKFFSGIVSAAAAAVGRFRQALQTLATWAEPLFSC